MAGGIAMSQKPTIIFVCLHGAAKSIVAASYLDRIANETGVELHTVARGIEPDLKLSEAAVTGLLNDGLSPTELMPQKLLPEELKTAHRVISFCELPEAYQGKTGIIYWEKVPAVSENYELARDAIVANIHDLLQDLSSR